MHYRAVVSWGQMFWPHETNTAEYVLHDYSQDSIIILRPHVLRFANVYYIYSGVCLA